MSITSVSVAEARNQVRWYILLRLGAAAMAVYLWAISRYTECLSMWIISEFFYSHQIQYKLYASRLMDEEEDGSWPWCEACKSYHHPKNPTCKA